MNFHVVVLFLPKITVLRSRVHYDQIVLFSTNQIADILYVSDKWTYAECLLHLLQNIFLHYIYYFKVLPQNIIRYTNIRNT